MIQDRSSAVGRGGRGEGEMSPGTGLGRYPCFRICKSLRIPRITFDKWKQGDSSWKGMTRMQVQERPKASDPFSLPSTCPFPLENGPTMNRFCFAYQVGLLLLWSELAPALSNLLRTLCEGRLFLRDELTTKDAHSAL